MDGPRKPIARRLDDGEVTLEEVEQLLTTVYGPDDIPDKIERRNRVVVDGEINKFGLVALDRAATEALRRAPAGPSSPPVPPEFSKDIPEALGDEDRPDIVGAIKAKLGILSAVRLWGKPQGEIRATRVEGVKIRCPFEHHTDNDPSAWVNTEKNTWFCGGAACQVGGDVIDFYAARFHGLEPSEFHSDDRFKEIIREMADQLGISVFQSGGVWTIDADTARWPSHKPDTDSASVDPVPEDIPEDAPAEIVLTEEEFYEEEEPVVPRSAEADEPTTISVEDVERGIALDQTDDLDDRYVLPTDKMPFFNWRDLHIPEDTFLYQWMAVNTDAYPAVPPEFFLAVGVQAIGVAAGHWTTSMSMARPLNGQSMHLLIGWSGNGKSTAMSRFKHLMRNSREARWDRDAGTGVKVLASPASAEALIKQIKTEIEDSADVTKTYEVATTAWLGENELATFISKSKRMGSDHLKQAVMELWDFVKESDDPELSFADYSAGEGHRELHDSFFATTFLTQPDAARDLLTSGDLKTGFLNRFVPWAAESSVRVPTLSPPPMAEVDRYISKFDRMWLHCRRAKRMIRFSPGAGELFDTHPFILNLAKNRDDLMSRVSHHTYRLAFLLAVNENSSEVQPHQMNAAINLMSEYIVPSFEFMRGRVLSTEASAWADSLVHYIEAYHRKYKRWPKIGDVKNQRFYRNFQPAKARVDVLESLFRDQVVIQIKLKKDVSAQSYSIWVSTTGKFAKYSDSHGKMFIEADFYA